MNIDVVPQMRNRLVPIFDHKDEDGSPRRIAAGALFAVTFPTLMGVRSILNLPPFGPGNSPPNLIASFIVTWVIPSLWLWLIVRAWPRAASAYNLTGAPYPAPGHPAEKAQKSRPVSGGWEMSAWVFIAIAAFDLLGVVLQTRAVYNMPSGRALGCFLAGIALLTLKPRWRTGAIVTLWTYGAYWILGLILGASHLEYAQLRFFGSWIQYYEQPFAFLLVTLAGLITFIWPYYLLTSEKGKALFGLDAKP